MVTKRRRRRAKTKKSGCVRGQMLLLDCENEPYYTGKVTLTTLSAEFSSFSDEKADYLCEYCALVNSDMLRQEMYAD